MRPLLILVLLVDVWLFCGAADALFAGPDATVPSARLIANLEVQLEKTPGDAALHSQLARVHSLVYALGKETIPVRKNEKVALELYDNDRTRRLTVAAGQGKRIPHLRKSLQGYKKATDLEPANSVYWLGFAYMCEEASKIAEHVALPLEGVLDVEVEKDARKRFWEELAVEAYAKTMTLDPEMPQAFNTRPVAIEAADSIIRLLSTTPTRSPAQEEWMRTAKAMQELWAKRPRSRIVTPIVFSLEVAKPVDALLAPQVIVDFDLDGTESGKRWPWVQPDTALLVWDGDQDGIITSGRSLIGSVTWWIFWENGYAVLAALDDDRNGWLSGGELSGLAIWRDANQNGISDTGEVLPLGAVGIRRLNVHISGSTMGMPMSAVGLEMNDGRVLPTYDWIAEEVR